MFERLSAEPIYNTRAVVRRTGVPADTFRAWERRYGVPSPLRTGGNQRLYSERDIRVIAWLREQTAVGLTISQAILLMRSSKSSIVHTLTHQAATIDRDIEEVLSGKRSDFNDPLVSARRRLVDAFSRLDGQAAEHVLQETYAWADLEIVLVELLHGAIIDINKSPGLLPPDSPVWHFGRAFVYQKFASLYNVSSPNDGRGPILSAAVDGEMHDLTILLSAVFLSRAGYRIIFLGSNLPFESLTSAIGTVRPAVVCLAASTESSAATLLDWIGRLAKYGDGSGFDFAGLPICYSGRAFIDYPALQNGIAGRFLGHSAQDAVANVELAMMGKRH